MDEPRILSKCAADVKEVGCCRLRNCDCFMRSCWASVDADEDDEGDDGCPFVVHCLPAPIEPRIDDELEPIDEGAVETPP